MAKTLNTKQVAESTTEEGVVYPAHTLYRYTDENDEGGIWQTSLERAEVSWERWESGAPGRERRRAESARLSRLSEEHGEDADDPFARFDRPSAQEIQDAADEEDAAWAGEL